MTLRHILKFNYLSMCVIMVKIEAIILIIYPSSIRLQFLRSRKFEYNE
jgi:hypothetical protein